MINYNNIPKVITLTNYLFQNHLESLSRLIIARTVSIWRLFIFKLISCEFLILPRVMVKKHNPVLFTYNAFMIWRLYPGCSGVTSGSVPRNSYWQAMGCWGLNPRLAACKTITLKLCYQSGPHPVFLRKRVKFTVNGVSQDFKLLGIVQELNTLGVWVIAN